MSDTQPSVAEVLAKAAEDIAAAREQLGDQMRMLQRTVHTMIGAFPPATRRQFNAPLRTFDEHALSVMTTSLRDATRLRDLARELRTLPVDPVNALGQPQVH